MTETQMQLLVLKGLYSEMPAEEKLKCDEAITGIKALIAANGESGQFAAMLVVLEIAADA